MTDQCTPIPKPGKRRKVKPDETFRLLYREMPCIVPGCEATPTCFAHHPHTRGMGGTADPWAFDKGCPSCGVHHKRLDAQGETWALHEEALAIFNEVAPVFWAWMRGQIQAAGMLRWSIESQIRASEDFATYYQEYVK